MLSWFEEHNKISWGITLFGAVLIFYFSSLEIGAGGGFGLMTLFYHFFAFFAFAFFLHISLLRGENNYLLLLLGALIAVFYGITDEIHQYFVPGRVCGLFDVGINSLGILLSSIVYLITIEFRRKIFKH